jgi:hypothetical protein
LARPSSAVSDDARVRRAERSPFDPGRVDSRQIAASRHAATAKYPNNPSLALKPIPAKLDRCVIAWPDPNSSNVRPFMGDSFYNKPSTWGLKYEIKY